jgi:hypothetical protein
MRKACLLLAAAVIVGCDGGREPGAGSEPVGDAPLSGSMNDSMESTALVDNSAASAYKVLVVGNSHASGLFPILTDLLALGQPGKSIDVRLSSRSGFLADRLEDGVTERDLDSERWTHVILQGQKYSTSGVNDYPTAAAEYWVRASKRRGATPIMFPEHPRQGNQWEGQSLWDLHQGISARERTCVAPVGLVWDEVIFRAPSLSLHLPDGNHASSTGLLLTALVFYPIITGQPVGTLPELSMFGIDVATEQLMKESVALLLQVYAACDFEE